MVSEEITASLEEQSASALLCVPRATRDILRLHDDAISLRNFVAGILDKPKKYKSSLASVLSTTEAPNIIHTYDTVFHGFSTKLSSLEALKLQTLPHVVAVISEQVRRLQTTRSPKFLGPKTTDNAKLLNESNFGFDLVIELFDTGIWLERQSSNDRELGPIPAKWKG
ncbi:hypothetical protein SLEP1_g23058 [Rubroshorea leprosula]|uniref:Inhibitor I9 domain-containing protein n=1 Tax=Rubroshorea leprosula TaxID=152421 RepID=A0AAV5JB97_9ROSI|nr:hypothetical protein SLEP1_g23058 [Rubroshorea leprosula]